MFSKLFYYRKYKAGTKFAENFSESFVVSLQSLWFFFFSPIDQAFHY